MATAGERREAILAAAQLLMHKHGRRGTSMEAIARQAGIAKPTLYAYFANKDEVFAALVAGLVGRWRAAFVAALDGEGDIVQRVSAALTAKHKAVLLVLEGSPHAAELYGAYDRLSGAPLRTLDAELSRALEAALAAAGVGRARLLTQILLAASSGIGHAAQSSAELGPALRLLVERLVRPELAAQ